MLTRDEFKERVEGLAMLFYDNIDAIADEESSNYDQEDWELSININAEWHILCIGDEIKSGITWEELRDYLRVVNENKEMRDSQ